MYTGLFNTPYRSCEICSRLTMKAPMKSFCCLHFWLWTYLTRPSNGFKVGFEQAIVCWVKWEMWKCSEDFTSFLVTMTLTSSWRKLVERGGGCGQRPPSRHLVLSVESLKHCYSWCLAINFCEIQGFQSFFYLIFPIFKVFFIQIWDIFMGLSHEIKFLHHSFLVSDD